MQFFQDILTATVVSTGAFEAYDLVSYAGAKVAADDAIVLGVAKSPNTVIGDAAPVMLSGIARVKAVGIITLGQIVVSAAAGGVKAGGATPTNPLGRAMTAAADGEFVTVYFR